ALILDVLCHAPPRGFCGVQIAGRIDGDPFSHGSFGRIGLVRRNEDRHLAVLQASDANALEPARVPLRRRFGVGRINRVVSVDRQPAYPAELPIFTDKPAVLRQNLDPVVVAVGDEQPPPAIQLYPTRRPALPPPPPRPP